MSKFYPKQARLFADWYGQGRADSAPPRNFCLNGPIDLKFGMQIVLGKISQYREKKLEKIARKLLKMLISAFF